MPLLTPRTTALAAPTAAAAAAAAASAAMLPPAPPEAIILPRPAPHHGASPTDTPPAGHDERLDAYKNVGRGDRCRQDRRETTVKLRKQHRERKFCSRRRDMDQDLADAGAMQVEPAPGSPATRQYVQAQFGQVDCVDQAPAMVACLAALLGNHCEILLAAPAMTCAQLLAQARAQLHNACAVTAASAEGGANCHTDIAVHAAVVMDGRLHQAVVATLHKFAPAPLRPADTDAVLVCAEGLRLLISLVRRRQFAWRANLLDDMVACGLCDHLSVLHAVPGLGFLTLQLMLEMVEQTTPQTLAAMWPHFRTCLLSGLNTVVPEVAVEMLVICQIVAVVAAEPEECHLLHLDVGQVRELAACTGPVLSTRMTTLALRRPLDMLAHYEYMLLRPLMALERVCKVIQLADVSVIMQTLELPLHVLQHAVDVGKVAPVVVVSALTVLTKALISSVAHPVPAPAADVPPALVALVGRQRRLPVHLALAAAPAGGLLPLLVNLLREHVGNNLCNETEVAIPFRTAMFNALIEVVDADTALLLRLVQDFDLPALLHRTKELVRGAPSPQEAGALLELAALMVFRLENYPAVLRRVVVGWDLVDALGRCVTGHAGREVQRSDFALPALTRTIRMVYLALGMNVLRQDERLNEFFSALLVDDHTPELALRHAHRVADLLDSADSDDDDFFLDGGCTGPRGGGSGSRKNNVRSVMLRPRGGNVFF